LQWLENYFSELFKEPPGCTIEDILKVVSLYPKVVSNEDNDSLKEEIFVKEILSTLEAFHKGKSLGPNDLSVEFYLGFFELIKEDLKKVVNESRSLGKIWPTFNKTFLDLIPKKIYSSSFEDFRPISCCNLIYNS
jgi:hypothetical protein